MKTTIIYLCFILNVIILIASCKVSQPTTTAYGDIEHAISITNISKDSIEFVEENWLGNVTRWRMKKNDDLIKLLTK